MDLSIVCLLVLSGLVWRAFSRDYFSGVCLSVGILVSSGTGIAISLGALPQITVHRVILVIWLFFYPAYRRSGVGGVARPPGLSILWLILMAKFVSTLLSIEPASSFKDWLGFMIEQVVFYVLLYRSIRNQTDAFRVIRAAVIGLGIVCGIAFTEYYGGINLAGYVDPSLSIASDEDSIVGTFRHRILLGYAMSMIFPLALLILQSNFVKRKSIVVLVCLASMAVCYFANSRGPWVGAGMAGFILVCLGGRRFRIFLGSLALFAACFIAIRPGVRSTIVDLVVSTFDPNSARGESYAYRNELWGVALHEISKSPERFLFGYGAVSTDFMDLSSQFRYGGNTTRTGYSSWDSQYACDLIELGIIGLGLGLILHFFLLLRLWKNYRQSLSTTDRQLQAACLAVVAIFLWALTNVAMFSVQLKFLFWLVVAVSFALKKESSEKDQLASMP